MKSVRSIFIGLTCLGMATASFAQEEETTPEATTYKAEIFGSVASATIPLSGWLAIDTELFLWKRITDI